MVKIFLTGDNHIGLTYDRYEEIKDVLKESRLKSLSRMISYANQEACAFFVVAGDLFHRISGNSKKQIRQVTEILGNFDGTVLVLPGNHDYYADDVKLWQDFVEESADKPQIHLLNEFRAVSFEVEDGKTATFYPAMCQSKHSSENNLGWIKQQEIHEQNYNVGIAHGAITGITPDMKNEYFQMEEKELREIPMDLWLIGHTHITWPENIPCEEGVRGHRIFNAGTHEQTDLSCRTEGNGFLLQIEKDKTIVAKRFVSGKIRYYDKKIVIAQDSLREKINRELADIEPQSSVVRITLTGSLEREEYAERNDVYQELEDRFLAIEIQDAELSERITEETIRDEFSELSFPATFLTALSEDSMELQMAYDLVRQLQK